MLSRLSASAACRSSAINTAPSVVGDDRAQQLDDAFEREQPPLAGLELVGRARRPATPGAPARARDRTAPAGRSTGCARSHDRSASLITLNAAGDAIGARPASTPRPSSVRDRRGSRRPAASCRCRLRRRAATHVARPARAPRTAWSSASSSAARPTTTAARFSPGSPRTPRHSAPHYDWWFHGCARRPQGARSSATAAAPAAEQRSTTCRSKT